MKAIVQTGAESIELQERDRPEPNEDEVLIRVHTAGLCGSDAHAYLYDKSYEWIPIPRIMGHEYAGEVVEAGRMVTEFQPGEKVVEEPIHDCGFCFQCKNGQSNVCQNFSITGMHRDGAYAEFVTVDPQHLHAVPDAVPLRHAAITEPLSIATRAVLTQSIATSGDNVLVEGPGPIGVFTAVVADSIGTDVVVSGLEQDAAYRLPLLEELGIDTINLDEQDIAEHAEARTEGIGFDVVFDATGHRTGVEIGADCIRKGGQIVVVGIPSDNSSLSMPPLVRGEVDINTSYGSTWGNFEQALRLMENEKIDPDVIIDTAYTIENPSDAFTDFLDSKTCKPVFSFSE